MTQTLLERDDKSHIHIVSLLKYFTDPSKVWFLGDNK